jgi:carbonic anhydrase/acetyltransferase-like protein (isoleucine patch superfamily)
MYVAAGTTVSSPDDVATKVHQIYAGYTYEHTNDAVVHVNEALAAGYLAKGETMDHIAANVVTDFSHTATFPTIAATTFVHPLASVIGNVTMEGNIMMSPCASVRGDEGQPIYVGEGANIQDGVVLHGLETEELPEEGELEFVNNRQFTAEGQKVSDGSGYSVYIAERASLAHQVQIHGPAYIGHDTFIAMQAFVFNAKVGSHCVIEPGCTIVGVEIPDNMYVAAGTTVSSPDDVATKVHQIYAGYTYEHTNDAVVHVNEALAAGYLEANNGGLTGETADVIPPAIICPSNISLTTTVDGVLARNAKIAAFLNGVEATDNVDSSVTVTNNAPAKFGIGNTDVTFTAADSAGNTSNCKATVAVKATGNSYASALLGGGLFSGGIFWGTYTPYMLDSQQQMWNLYQLSPLSNFTVLWQPAW